MESYVNKITAEEFYAAYLAATPEVQKEVRRLLGLEN